MPTVTYENCTPCCPSGGVEVSCYNTGSPDFTPRPIPNDLEVEFYDGTGDAACLNGVVLKTLSYVAVDGDWQAGTIPSPITTGVPCGGDEYWLHFQACQGAFNNEFSFAGSVIGGTLAHDYILFGGQPEDSVSGSGSTFEAIFIDMAVSTNGAFGAGSGVLSCTVRARTP